MGDSAKTDLRARRYSKQKNKDSCRFITCRRVLNIMVFLGFMVNYMLRVNLTFAIVDMIMKAPEVTTSPTISSEVSLNRSARSVSSVDPEPETSTTRTSKYNYGSVSRGNGSTFRGQSISSNNGNYTGYLKGSNRSNSNKWSSGSSGLSSAYSSGSSGAYNYGNSSKFGYSSSSGQSSDGAAGESNVILAKNDGNGTGEIADSTDSTKATLKTDSSSDLNSLDTNNDVQNPEKYTEDSLENGTLILYTVASQSKFIPIQNLQLENDTSASTVKPKSDRVRRFDWSEAQQGILIGSFFWGYICTELPGGRFSELIGARKVFGYATLGASVITLLTPLAAKIHFLLVVIIRILLGLFLGTTWPAILPLAANWIPPNERGQFMSNMMGSTLGAGFTLPVCGYIIAILSWEFVFYITGLIGFLWSVAWFLLVYDSPAKHPRISTEERYFIEASLGHSPPNESSVKGKNPHGNNNGIPIEMNNINCNMKRKPSLIDETDVRTAPMNGQQHDAEKSTHRNAAVPSKSEAFENKPSSHANAPWGKILTSVPVWAFIITHGASVFGYNTITSQLPTYMKYILHFNIKENGMLSSFPYIGKYIMALVGGSVADMLLRSSRFSKNTIRKSFTVIAVMLPGLFIIFEAFLGEDKFFSIFLFTAALTVNGMVTGGYLGNSLDLAPNYSGTIFGLANMLSGLGGAISAFIVGYLTDHNQVYGQWQKVFWIVGIIYLIGAVTFVTFGATNVQPWNDLQTSSTKKLSVYDNSGDVSKNNVTFLDQNENPQHVREKYKGRGSISKYKKEQIHNNDDNLMEKILKRCSGYNHMILEDVPDEKEEKPKSNSEEIRASHEDIHTIMSSKNGKHLKDESSDYKKHREHNDETHKKEDSVVGTILHKVAEIKHKVLDDESDDESETRSENDSVPHHEDIRINKSSKSEKRLKDESDDDKKQRDHEDDTHKKEDGIVGSFIHKVAEIKHKILDDEDDDKKETKPEVHPVKKSVTSIPHYERGMAIEISKTNRSHRPHKEHIDLKSAAAELNDASYHLDVKEKLEDSDSSPESEIERDHVKKEFKEHLSRKHSRKPKDKESERRSSETSSKSRTSDPEAAQENNDGDSKATASGFLSSVSEFFRKLW